MHQEMQRMIQIDEGSGENTSSIDEDANTYELWQLIKKVNNSYTD